jgi:succinate-acetate transporter protein
MDSNDFAATKSEENDSSATQENHLERLHTAGGHINDQSQPSLPVYHRTFANPSPLGLISFATGTSPLPC